MRQIVCVVMLLVVLLMSSCAEAQLAFPEQSSDNTLSSSTYAPTNGSTCVTSSPQEEYRYSFFMYDEGLNEKLYAEYGDVSSCKQGYYYSYEHRTGVLKELHDDSIWCYQEKGPFGAEPMPDEYGEYIYYILKSEKNTIYRMNYSGTVSGELVYQSKTGPLQQFDYAVHANEKGADRIAILEDQSRILCVSPETGESVLILEFDGIVSIASFWSDASDNSDRIAFQDQAGVIYIYNITTETLSTTGVH